MLPHLPHRARRPFAVASLGAAGILLAAGCGSSGTKASSSTPTTAASSSSSNPGTAFSASSTSALGRVVVDARGYTVYVLTADGHTNLPCEDASGCTKVWPDLPFPDGVSSAKAGSGIDASKLSSMKESDGETYPTYNGWLMYEFAKDTGPAQTNGEGIHSFGGTWYALTSSGTLVQPAAASSATTGGYSYP